MSITQKEADIIVQNIKNDLHQQFGDIEKITLLKAKLIQIYCKHKMSLYDGTNSVEYAYWFHLYRAYTMAVDATNSADKIQD